MSSGEFRFYCKTCPYIFKVENKFEDKKLLERKEVDDVFILDEAWEDASKTEIKCANFPTCMNQ